MSNRAFLGMSHTPLMGLNPISQAIDSELQAAIGKARNLVRAFNPELIVLIAPDHYNGFFNELMPPFCIGTQVQSVGDYMTPVGDLNVDSETALVLANGLMDDGFDIAISRRMRVDHGFAQPLQLLWGDLDTPPVIPIFVNAVATPNIPRLKRCRALGKSLGDLLKFETRRTLFIGSGGLSHEPPVPTLENPDPAIRERITARQYPTQEERDAKTQRVMAAGMALASGQSAMKPLNPAWDKQWMDAVAGNSDALDRLCTMSETTILNEGGGSAHESKNWLIARSALNGAKIHTCTHRYYQAIPEYIAGFGIMFLNQADS